VIFFSKRNRRQESTCVPAIPSGFMDRVGKITAMTSLICFTASSELATKEWGHIPVNAKLNDMF
jgi:hypothetical protein